MSERVIRRDIIQIDFETNLKELTKITKSVDELRKNFTKGLGSDAFSDLKKNAASSVSSLDKVKKSASGVNSKLTEIGKKGSVVAFNGLKKVAGVSFKALTVGITGAATAIGAIVTSSVKAYAENEQLVGGVDTLFKDHSKTVQKYANNAYKTAGLSANAYMETATSFSASLLQSLGGDTKKAAEYADMAISDMADNANKMGTPMESIQETYQSLAKGNYQMLDNLKLGYGGTKSEMERLIKEAAKMDKSIDANSTSYGNLVKAIHVVQENMGITGTTQKEAEKTITGSLSAMKAAWGNLLPALIQGGDGFDQCVENLVSSVLVFKDNAMPAVEKALSGVGTLITKLAPTLEKEFPKLVDELLPPLITAATALLKGLIKALPSIIKTLVKELPNILKSVGEAIAEAFGMDIPAIGKFGEAFAENAKKIAKIVPVIIGVVAAFKLLTKVKSIGSGLSDLFGKKSPIAADGNKGGLFSGLKEFANIKPTVILKAMGNIAIILGGFTILAAVFMKVAPYMAKLSDFKSVIEVLGVISLLGLVGTGLAKLAGIVGKIPIMTVVKGLANIGIILAGMSALFLLIGATSLLKFDLNKIMKITAIIGLLGLVGSVLAGFAGIIGLIPIPVVLAGLANIALVIGGMTAIIVAFGALSKTPKFNEFISKGGDTLANLFKQIGKIGGSLIGGIGEGITNSLPKIGENLTAFAKSLKPAITMFQGVDAKGIGSFFTSVGSFMLKMTGNKVLSALTGGSNLGTIGTELTTFADNSEGFFTKVAEFPKNGFTNAKALFKSLSDIGNLPKTGGLKQWFGGETDFVGLATGLKQLSGEGVVSFYNTVAKIPAASFENAKALFKSLSDIGNVPKSGGIKQWFTGENDFEGLSKKLPSFGKAMAKFYASIAGISDFSKIKSLFNALKGISKAFPKTGGIKQLFTGDNDISGVGESLKKFGTDTKEFFASVNKLNVGKLNDLWKSLKKPSELTESMLDGVSANIKEIVKKVSDLPSKMGEGIKGAGESLSSALVKIWKDAVKATAKPVNKLLSGANWILQEFGSEKRVEAWKPYAKGTDGHKGGNALVNDGRGAELVQMPNGSSFIPRGKNVFLPNAPVGMKVLPANQTAKLMGRKTPTFNYAKGTGNIDIWDYLDDSKGLVNSVSDKFVNYDDVSGLSKHLSKGMVGTIKSGMVGYVSKLYDEMGALSLANYDPSKGVEQWRTTVIRALKMEDQYSPRNVNLTLYQMQTESGGNPKAINLWDSNAKAGIPSKGLMQVIDPTFKAYARAGFNKNIYDPLSNILASVRYAVSRYGSLGKAYRGVGYANGGIATSPSIFGEDGAEMAIPLSRNKRKQGINLWNKTGSLLGMPQYSPDSDIGTYNTSNIVENNTYSPQFTVNISGSNDDRTMARKVKTWIKESLQETFDSIDRKNPRLREI